MKHLKTFEAFTEQDIMVDEGWKEVKSAITKPFRKKTPEEIEKAAWDIINSKKLLELEQILKNAKNPIHYKNYMNAKGKYQNNDKMPFYSLVCFLYDNIDSLKTGTPLYYKIEPSTGLVVDTRQEEFSSGPGGRRW